MIVAVMVAMYVLLDGFDIGAGAVHLFNAQDDTERRTILRAIGPVWEGNDVWLLAAAARSCLRSRYFTRRASAASTFS
jgi:cytochrome d ubiquinol oxidase subunit II